jgi:predicted nucleic acid-binding protein
MRVLVDTNVLLRSAQPSHPFFFQGSESIARLLEQHHQLFFCPQNIVEFWSVATRPVAQNGLGLTQPKLLKEIASIEKSLTLLPDSSEIYEAWKRIAANHQVLGAKVHDARLVAVMTVYGVENILTFDASDFNRYASIRVLSPSSVVA